MSTQERRSSDSQGGQLGSLLLATVLGVGVGLLAAPQSGSDTRRALRKRMDSLREDFGDEVEELQDASSRAGRRVRRGADSLRRHGRKVWDDAAEELEEFQNELADEDEGRGGGFVTALTVAAGLGAAAYFLTSERAAPARARVREAAATVRDEAEDRWDRFQRRRSERAATPNGTRAEATGTAPQAS